MLLLHVDTDDALPVHDQLRQQLHLLIASGALAPGARLPTIRQLAADLGVAKGTVSRVYESLFQEGMIEGNRRRGTAVATRPSTRPAGETSSALAQHALRLALAALQAGVTADIVHNLVDEAMASLKGAG